MAIMLIFTLTGCGETINYSNDEEDVVAIVLAKLESDEAADPIIIELVLEVELLDSTIIELEYEDYDVSSLDSIDYESVEVSAGRIRVA
jgi:hypothetical protein